MIERVRSAPLFRSYHALAAGDDGDEEAES
jgi:hypothetical protein